MILYVVSDRDGYYQVLQVTTRDLLSLVFRLWWVFPLCPMILYVVLDCDKYYLVYLSFCSCVSLIGSKIWKDLTNSKALYGKCQILIPMVHTYGIKRFNARGPLQCLDTKPHHCLQCKHYSTWESISYFFLFSSPNIFFGIFFQNWRLGS
jgi:hypothetical protein